MKREEDNTTFTKYLKAWSRDLSSSQPSFECPQILEAYWQLEKLVADIMEECYNIAEPMFDRYPNLLHAARIAREARDLIDFAKVCSEVEKIWRDYLDTRKAFQFNVDCSIEAIHDIVRKGSSVHQAAGREEEARQRNRACTEAIEEIRRGRLGEPNLQKDGNTRKRKRSLSV